MSSRIVDPSTAAPLKVETVRARGREQVLQALDELARKLRRDLGESVLSVIRRGVPLPLATTASLDALKKFADGQRAFDAGGWREAKELWLAALALDSSFALAHAALGGLFYWVNDRPSGEAQFTKALSLLERLTDRERLSIRAQAAGWRGDREEAINILKTLLLQYPDDRRAWFNLGYNYLRWGHCREALDAYTKLLAIDSLDPDTYVNIATCHGQLGEYEQALARYRQAFALRPDLVTWENINHEFGGMYVVTGRFDEARATFEKMLAGTANQQARGHRSLALLEMFRGKYEAAIPHLREAMLLTRAQKAALSEARNHLFLAVAFQAQGKMDAFRAELNEVYHIFKRAYLEPRFLLFAGKLYARSGDVRRSSELLDTLVHRVNESSSSDRADMLVLQGEVALAKDHAADAVNLFESALALDETNYTRESLAYALAEQGNLDEAVRRYQELARRTEFGWEAQPYWLLANYQLGQLYETKDDTVNAIRSYAAFLDIWKAADKGLPDLIDARNRLSRLRARQRVG
jgi:tetratricopeptide (TPR) repeat protein